jgi:hypothetical protein
LAVDGPMAGLSRRLGSQAGGWAGLDAVFGSCGNPALDGAVSVLAGRFRLSASSVGGVTVAAAGFVAAVSSHFGEADGGR